MMDNIVEAEVFDPDGSYIRRWLPALARLPIKYIHKYGSHLVNVLLEKLLKMSNFME